MDTWINPVTRDYEPDASAPGSLQRDPAGGILNAAYLRLMTPLGSWFGELTIGSRLYELQREKDVPRVLVLAKRYAQDALAPLVLDGRLQRVDVDVERQKDASGAGRLALRVQLVNPLGATNVFKLYVKVA